MTRTITIVAKIEVELREEDSPVPPREFNRAAKDASAV